MPQFKSHSFFSSRIQTTRVKQLLLALYRKNLCGNTKWVFEDERKNCTKIIHGMLTNGLSSFKNYLRVTLSELTDSNQEKDHKITAKDLLDIDKALGFLMPILEKSRLVCHRYQRSFLSNQLRANMWLSVVGLVVLSLSAYWIKNRIINTLAEKFNLQIELFDLFVPLESILTCSYVRMILQKSEILSET